MREMWGEEEENEVKQQQVEYSGQVVVLEHEGDVGGGGPGPHSYLGRAQRFLVGPEPASVSAGIATAVQVLTHSGSEGGLLLVDDLPPHPAAVAALLEALEAGVAVAAVLEGYSCLEELVAVADGRDSSSGNGLVSEQLRKASAVVRGAWTDWEADHGGYQQQQQQQQQEEEVKREQQQFASMLLEALGLLGAGPASQPNARAEGSGAAASASSSSKGGGGSLHHSSSSSSTHGLSSAQEAAAGRCYLVDMQAADRCVVHRSLSGSVDALLVGRRPQGELRELVGTRGEGEGCKVMVEILGSLVS